MSSDRNASRRDRGLNTVDRGGGRGRGQNPGRGASNRGRGSGPQTRGGRGGAASQNTDVGSQVRVDAGGQTLRSGTDLTQVSEEEEICGFCKDRVDENPIGCDKCSLWYHSKPLCTGLRELTIRAILGEDAEAIRYVCNNCRFSPRAVSSPSSPGNEGISQLYETVKSLAKSVSTLTSQVSALVSRPTHHNCQSQSNPESAQFIKRADLYGEIREIEERRKRMNSIIVRGVEAIDNGSFKATLSRVLQVLIQKDTETASVFCLNRENKLYRVDIANKDDRLALLSNAKNLKDNSEFSDIYISKDLTFTQRKENAKRRVQARLSNPRNSSTNSPLTPPNTDAAANLADTIAGNTRQGSRLPPPPGGGRGNDSFP